MELLIECLVMRTNFLKVSTGRLTSTSQSHLQAISALAIDSTSNYLLSGSLDSTVLVWSLTALLTFSNTDSSAQLNPRSPISSLSNHRGPITCLAIGHSQSQLDVAISGSEDSSVVIWDYKKGTSLCTYLLQAIPRSLILDVSDRGFFTTYDEGSVQLIDLFANSGSTRILYDDDQSQVPMQPGEQNLWKAEGQDLGPGISLTLSWDGSKLLSGHKSGKIVSWDTGKGTFMAVMETLPGAVTNLVTLPLEGFPQAPNKSCRAGEVVKPRMVTADSGNIVSGDYSFSTQLTRKNATPAFSAVKPRSMRKSTFEKALTHPSFSASLLEEGIAELAGGQRSNAKASSNGAGGEDTQEGEDIAKKELEDLKAHNEHLQQQCANLQRLQKASFSQIREKTRVISGLVKEQQHLAEIAKAEHGWEIHDINLDWHTYQQRLQNGRGRENSETQKNIVVAEDSDDESEADDVDGEEEDVQMDLG